MNRYKHAVPALVLLITIVVGGCSGGYKIPETTTLDAAQQTLTLALDAWKSGKDTASLAENEKLYVGDESWSRGDRLTQYALVGPGEAFGTTVRFMVDLELTSPRGESLRQRACYVVGTNPVQSVKRDDSAEPIENIEDRGSYPRHTYDES